MYECEYSREPVDYRLIWLRFLKSIWIFFVCAIIGAAVVGGIHSIKKLVVSGGRSYQAESLYYFEYGCSTEVLTTTAYNYYTWGEIGKSDLIVDALLEKVGDKVSREELRASITLTCDSDVRYVYSRVTTHDRNLSVEIAKAMESVLPAFVLNHKEFSDAYVVTHAESAIEVTNYRIGNAIILGCFIG